MIQLTSNFLRHYPDAVVDNDFVVISRGRAIYHSIQRMMVRFDVGFSDPVNDEHTLVRYSVFPCEVKTAPDGDQWIASDKVPTFTKVVTHDEAMAVVKQCRTAGYQLLHCDASTNPSLVSSDQPNERLQAGLDRARLKHMLQSQGLA